MDGPEGQWQNLSESSIDMKRNADFIDRERVALI